MYLSVIIPAKNEEQHIRKTVESVFSYCSKKNWEHEIIVVANNSTDHTAAIVKNMQAEIPSVRLIEFAKPHIKVVKGLAVKTGMLAARGEFRLFMDADNSTTIETVDAMLPFFREGYQVVIASIAAAGARVDSGSEPLWRRAFGRLGNWYIQLLAVPGIADTQRGFKMLAGPAAERIFSQLTIAGWGFDIELLALARRYGYRIKEVPIHWHNDPQSHVGLSAYGHVLRETLRVRWNLWTNKYHPRNA